MPRIHHDKYYSLRTPERYQHAETVIEEEGCTSFDWAFPIDWCIDFVKKTGFEFSSGEIIWAYANTSIFGKPVALTIRAQEALDLAAEAAG